MNLMLDDSSGPRRRWLPDDDGRLLHACATFVGLGMPATEGGDALLSAARAVAISSMEIVRRITEKARSRRAFSIDTRLAMRVWS